MESFSFSERAEAALVRLAMLVELHENRYFRVFRSFRERVELLQVARESDNEEVHQQLIALKHELNRTQIAIIEQAGVDLSRLHAHVAGHEGTSYRGMKTLREQVDVMGRIKPRVIYRGSLINL